MSNIDQCPSTTSSPQDAAIPSRPRDVSAATGKVYWRSLDDLLGTKEFTDFLHREFQPFASELLDGSRRYFLKIMGASLALAGAATIPGCRRPDHKILTFQKQPESLVVGKPLYYATAMPLPGGGCEGLLGESFDGRPVKVEGNPLHPTNRGKSSIHAQASVLSLYDPDRDPAALREIAKELDKPVNVMGWSEFEKLIESDGAAMLGDGSRAAIIANKMSSPSRDRMRDAVRSKYPRLEWAAWEPTDHDNAVKGARLALGGAYRPVADLSKAKVILSLDRDFLGTADPEHMDHSRGFAAGRYRPGDEHHPAGASAMSRVYVVESGLSITGGTADHRLRLKPSRIEAFAIALARAVMRKMPNAAAVMSGMLDRAATTVKANDFDQNWIDAAAQDLVDAGGEAVIFAGETLRPEIHALVIALNESLGATGARGPLRYARLTDDAAGDGASRLAGIVDRLNGGGLDTIIVVEANPVYDAPADLNFAAAYAKAKNRIHVGSPNETAFASTIHLELAHALEVWTDVMSIDGVYSVAQPMIKPLFDRRGQLELLAILLGTPVQDGYEVVRETMRRRTSQSGDAFERSWRRMLHNGRVDQDGDALASPRIASNAMVRLVEGVGAAALDMGPTEGVEVVFSPCPKVLDGRHGNNGWLQELPHPVTKVSWDNPALVSPATAERLGIPRDRNLKGPQYNHAKFIKVAMSGREIEVPVWVMPGVADDVVLLTLGYGRSHAGRVADDTGFNVYPLRGRDSMRVGRGADISVSTRGAYLLANTQDHWTMESRAILREVDHAAWTAHGDEDYDSKDPYDETRDLNFAASLGEESHTPKNRDIYSRAQQSPHIYYEMDEEGRAKRDAAGNIIGRKIRVGDNERRVQQWGMSIDLTTCTGCGTCTVACQAENNIPVVGKMETAKGREMHWIRVDRYFASHLPASHIDKDDPRRQQHEAVERNAFAADDVEMVVMPVACVHCESAPCEVVCPVNATVHGREGTNDMAYNRCIGTRYCSNNCPYKVRRFNYFDYATKQFRGSFGQSAEGVPDALMPSNPNFVPPRLREPITEVAQMQYNPHVTVRSRGVMEKCTYCIQRINQARVETKLEDLAIIPDGYFKTACQQACPTNAIVFGDIYDHDSEIHRLRFDDGRSYQLLSYLNTRPRTTYMIRLRNPNPAIRTPIEDPWSHGHGPGGHGDGHDNEHGHGETHGGHAEGRLMSLPILNNGGAPA